MQIPGYSAQYLFRAITSDRDQSVDISLGIRHAGVQVWLNGQLLLERKGYFDQERLTLDLKQGENQFLMKVMKETRQPGFYFFLNGFWESLPAEEYSVEQSLVVHVNDVNEAPGHVRFQPGIDGVTDMTSRWGRSGADMALGIKENLYVPVAIGTLSADDPDGDFPTFSVEGAGFEMQSGQLVLTQSLDFEARQSLEPIRLIARDSEGLTGEMILAIEVLDVPEPPIGIVLSTDQIAEAKVPGTLIGTLRAVGDPEGGPHTFHLVTGEGDTHNHLVTIDGSSLLSATTYSQSETPILSLRIQTKDSEGFTHDETISVSVVESGVRPFQPPHLVRVIEATDSWHTPVAVTTDGDGNIYLGQGKGSSVVKLSPWGGEIVQAALPSPLQESQGVALGSDGQIYVSRLTSILIFANLDEPSEVLIAGSGAAGLATGPNGTFFAGNADGVRQYDSAGQLIQSWPSASSVAGVAWAEDSVYWIAPSVPLIQAVDLASDVQWDFQATTGSLEGQFKGPQDLAVWDGWVWILDTGNNRIQVIEKESQALAYVLAGEDLGLSAFNQPRGIAVDAYGNIVIADTGNDRLIRLSHGAPVREMELSSRSVLENEAVGTLVGEFVVPGLDHGWKFELVSGDGDGHNQDFYLEGGKLFTSAAFDYETEAVKSVRARAQGRGGQEIERSVVIDVVDLVGEKPFDVDLSTSDVRENEAPGILVARFEVSDPDPADTFSFEFVAGDGDTENGQFSVDNQNLLVGAPLDFEQQPSASIRVRVTDSFGLQLEKVFVLNVLDSNEPPGEASLALSQGGVVENTLHRSFVGTLSGADPDAGDVLTFRLSSSAAGIHNSFFAVEPNGDLFSTQPVNYEETPELAIEAVVSDAAGLTLLRQFIIPVLDLDEEAPRLVRSWSTEGKELLPEGRLGDRSGDFQARISKPLGVAIGSQLELLVGSSGNGELLIVTPVSFSGWDSGKHGGATYQPELVRTGFKGLLVIDRAGSRIWQYGRSAMNSYDFVEAESLPFGPEHDLKAPAGMAVHQGKLYVTDREPGKVRVYKESSSAFRLEFDFEWGPLVPGAGAMVRPEGIAVDAAGDVFVADAGNHRILKFDPNGNLQLAWGELGPGAWQFNEPRGLAMDESGLYVADAGNHRIQKYTRDGQFLWSLGSEGSAGGEFRWPADVASNGQGRLVVADRDNDRLQSFSGLAGPFDLALSTLELEENQPVGAVVGNLHASHTVPGTTVEFEVVSINGDDNSGLFSINGNQLVVQKKFNAESDPLSYELVIRAYDGQWRETYLQETIRIVNQNDEPASLSLAVGGVKENLPSGSVIGEFTAVDEDVNDQHSLKLIAGEGDEDNELFNIDGTQLLTGAAFDYETQSQFSIRVRATDSQGGFLEQAFTIQLDDENEPPTDLALDGLEVYENQPVGTVVGRLSIEDEDLNDAHIFDIVVRGPLAGSQLFAEMDGFLVTDAVLDYEAASEIPVTLRVFDRMGLRFERDYNLVVRRVQQDAPELLLAWDLDLRSDLSQADGIHGTGIAVDSLARTYVTGETLNGDISRRATYSVYDFLGRRVQQVGVNGDSAVDIAVGADGFAYTGIWSGFTFGYDRFSWEGVKLKSATQRDFDHFGASAIAVGQDGRIYLVRSRSETEYEVAVYSADDQLQHSWPVSREVEGIAVDTSGNVYVADSAASTLIKFDPTGQVLWTRGDSWPAPYQLNTPSGLAVDAEGRLFVADQGNDRIVVCDTHGNFHLSFGSSGSEPGQMVQPTRVAVGPDGAIFVYDYGNSRVQKFHFGSAHLSLLSFEPAQFDEAQPIGAHVGKLRLARDGADVGAEFKLASGDGDLDNSKFTIVGAELILAEQLDYENQAAYQIRVRGWDLLGQSLEQSLVLILGDSNDAPSDVRLTGGSVAENAPAGTWVARFQVTDQDREDTFVYSLVAGEGDTHNHLFSISENELHSSGFADFEATSELSIRAQVTDKGGETIAKSFPITILDMNEAPAEIHLHGGYVFQDQPAGAVVGQLAADDPDRIERLHYRLTEGSPAAKWFEIRGSWLTTTAAGHEYVDESYPVEVTVMDKEGLTYNRTFQVGTRPRRLGPLLRVWQQSTSSSAWPITKSITSNDSLNRIGFGEGGHDRIDPTGTVQSFELSVQPFISGAAIDPVGRIIVTSSEEKKIYVFRPDGTLVTAFPLEGNWSRAHNRFEIPVAWEADRIWVLDRENAHVQGYDRSGNLLFTWGRKGVGPREMLDPYNLAVGPSSTVFVADRGRDRILKFSQDGLFISEWQPGMRAGVPFHKLQSISLDPFGFVWATLEFQRVVVFDLDGQLHLASERLTDDAFDPIAVAAGPDHVYYSEFDTTDYFTFASPPLGVSLSSTKVVENTAANTLVAALDGIDSDPNEQFTFELVSGEGDDANDYFAIAGNQLSLQMPVDYENQRELFIRLRVTDAQGHSIERPVVIEVVDVGESALELSKLPAPPSMNGYTPTHLERDSSGNLYMAGHWGNPFAGLVGRIVRFTPAGEELGQFELADEPRQFTLDADENLVVVTGDGKLTKLDRSGSVLWQRDIETSWMRDLLVLHDGKIWLLYGNGEGIRVLDSNGNPAGTIDVPARADDGTGMAYLASVVTGLGNAYVWAGTVVDGYQLWHMGADGTVKEKIGGPILGSLIKADIRTNDAYAVLQQNANNSERRLLLFDASHALMAERDLFADGVVGVVDVAAGDGSQTYVLEKSRDIYVLDAAASGLSDVGFSIGAVVEDLAVGQRLGQFTINGNAAGKGIEFELVTGIGSDHNGLVNVDGNTATLAGALNFETSGLLKFRVQATGLQGEILTRAFRLEILDVNEPPLDISLSHDSHSENRAPRTTVGEFQVTDDRLDTDHIMELVDGRGAQDNGSFVIKGGKLLAAGSFDYERQARYFIRVRATDSAGLFLEKELSVRVTDMPERAPALQVIATGENSLLNILEDPADIAIAGDGSVYISDSKIGQVFKTKLDPSNPEQLWAEPLVSFGSDDLVSPAGVAASASSVYVTDLGDHTVKEFDATGNLVRTLGGQGDGPGQFNQPRDVAVTPRNLYVLDSGNNRVQAFLLNGTFQFEWGGPGRNAGQFRSPTGITAEGASERIYVADTGNDRIQVFHWSGSLDRVFGAGGSFSGEFASPRAVTAWKDESVYVADTGNQRVSVHEFWDHSHADQFRIVNSNRGEMALPVDVALDSIGNLYVLHSGAPFVSTFALGRSLELSPSEISESAPAGNLIGRLEVEGSSDAHTFEVISGGGEDGQDLFTVAGDELRLAGTLDFEQQQEYLLRIRATSSTGLVFEQGVRVRLEDASEAPTGIRIVQNWVFENQPSGAAAGELEAYDPDGGETFQFELVDGEGADHNALFRIKDGAVLAGGPLDYEANPTCSIRVRMTDSQGLAFEQPLEIVVVDINEPPTVAVPSMVEASEGSGPVELELTGISDGDSGEQWYFVRAAADNAELVQSIRIQMEAFSDKALLKIHLAAGATGTSKIQVTIEDDGGSGLGGEDRTVRELELKVSEGVSLPGTARISGNVLYYEGMAALGGADIEVDDRSQGESVSISTGVDGFYEVELLSRQTGEIFILADKQDDQDPDRGITTLDIALVRRHILGTVGLDSPYRLLAADVDDTGSVSLSDLPSIRQMILRASDSFSAGAWKFVPSDHEFGDPQNPWSYEPFRFYASLKSDLSGQDFIGIKLGDVNGSWTSATSALLGQSTLPSRSWLLMNAIPASELEFHFPAVEAVAGGRLNVPVLTRHFKDVTSVQFTVQWDPAVLRYAEIAELNLPGLIMANFGVTRVEEGKLMFSWDDPEGAGVTLPDESPLFSIGFDSVEAEHRGTELQFGGDPTPKEVSVQFAEVEFGATGATVTLAEATLPLPGLEIVGLESLVDGQLKLKVSLPKPGRYAVEASADLNQWEVLGVWEGSESFEWIDSEAGNEERRFYRVRWAAPLP